MAQLLHAQFVLKAWPATWLVMPSWPQTLLAAFSDELPSIPPGINAGMSRCTQGLN
ncbi:hypothetical protein HD806DRAFT_482497, partial [Xylariaceae sp. AK1471]